MKRLYSYLTYVSVGLLPLAFIFFTISMNRHFKLTITYLLSNDLIVLIFLLAIIYSYIKVKRVYIKNASLYIYNIFSNKHVIVNKQNLVSIGRFLPLDPLSYKISYVDENNKIRTAYFIKNLFILNMSDAIVDLGS